MPSQPVDMARSKSSIPATSCPFTPGSGHGVVKPMMHQAQPSIMRYPDETEMQQPANSNLLHHPMNNVMSAQHRGSELSPVLETGGMETTIEWLQRMENNHDVRDPSDFAGQEHLFPAQPLPHRVLSTQELPTPHGHLSTMSPSTMSRSNTSSTTNQSVTGPTQMFRMDSLSSVSDIMPPPDAPSKKRPAPHNEEQSMGVSSLSPPMPFPHIHHTSMGRSASIDSRLPESYLQRAPQQPVDMNRRASMQESAMPPTMPQDSQLLGQLVQDGSLSAAAGEGEHMMRSLSSSSIQSTVSQRDRAKDSLQRQIQAAGTQPLAPKPKADLVSATSVAQKHTQAGTDGKLPVSKSTYVRRVKPKLHCNECDDGTTFRGDHELRRHKMSKHNKKQERWICVDPVTKGIQLEFPPLVSFSMCRTCSQKKKHYGQDYNVAAHLRRTHYKEKTPRASRSKNDNESKEPGEKRGGKGGGNWPPMDELRKWMETILVEADDLTDTTASDDEIQELDQKMSDGEFSASREAAPDAFNTAACSIGSNGNVQVKNTEVYANALDELPANFNDFSNYSVSHMPSGSTAMPSVASANFGFDLPISAHQNFNPDEIQMHFGMFQNSHDVPMASAMTHSSSFGDISQAAHYSSQPTNMPMNTHQQHMMEANMFMTLSNSF